MERGTPSRENRGVRGPAPRRALVCKMQHDPRLVSAVALHVFRQFVADVRAPVVPLKGIELAFGYYPSPAARPMSDVDVLLAAGDFDRAITRLCRMGYRRAGPEWSAVSLSVPPARVSKVD